MGNTPSHSSSGPGGASSPPTPASGGAIVIGGSSSTSHAPTSSAPTAIPTSSSSSSTRTGTTTTAAFHSGLTPPPAPPSPPPPSTPLLLPHAGHLSPQNPHALSHPQVHDYSKAVVTQLILDNQLAPFYRGLEDWEEDYTEDDVARILNELREKDYEEGVMNSYTARLKDEREPSGNVSVGSVAKKMGMHKNREAKLQEDKEERDRREKKAYLAAVECPICFLNYPPNINTSRCCQQPLCTECFVQIKRGEATLTHLESEPACCPFCVETDFGVIYERPNVIIGGPPTPGSGTSGNGDGSALATSPEVASVSGFSQALSMSSEDADLMVGPGITPKAQETARRKSVSSKAKEVVTIDEIRPDWENKLNAVKAAAARKAARRIVMRQVGDRLVPIGFTSARAPGTADFSMSIGQQAGNDDNNGNGSGGSGSRRSRRRDSGRERELEEAMIMEAMRLSLIDHEEHQRKIHIDRRDSQGNTPSPGGTPNATTPRHSLSGPSGSAGPSTPYSPSYSYSTSPETHTQTHATRSSSSTASKLLSKLSPGGRSRAGSKSSVTFAPSPMGPTGSGSANGSTRISPTPSHAPSMANTPTLSSTPPTGGGPGTSALPSSPVARSSISASSAPAPVPAPAPTAALVSPPSSSPAAPTAASATAPTPTSTGPVAVAAPVPALAGAHTHAHAHGHPHSPPARVSSPGLPRLSLDMPALTPDAPRKSLDLSHMNTAPVVAGVDASGGKRRSSEPESPVTRSHAEYAALESDEE